MKQQQEKRRKRRKCIFSKRKRKYNKPNVRLPPPYGTIYVKPLHIEYQELLDLIQKKKKNHNPNIC